MKKFISIVSSLTLALSLFAVPLPSAAAPLADGLVAYWNFDEGIGTTADEKVNNLDGTLNGNTGWVASGIVIGSANATSYDGDGDYTEVSDTGDLDITDELAISFWFKLAGNSGDNDWPRAVSKGQSTMTDGAYGVFIKDTTDPVDIGLRFIDQSNVTYDVRDTALPDYNNSSWHHVVATYSNVGDVGKLYLDGAEVESVAIPGDVKIRSTSDNLTIGSGRGDAERDFNGNIDEVRIYSRALSATEVTRLYSYGSFTLDVTPDTDTNPVGTDHEVTITLDTPLSYIPVLYNVSGNTAPGEDTQYIYTDENGQIVFTYTGVNPVTDSIIACIDTSWFMTGGGVCDAPFDEPSDTATKMWFNVYDISGMKYLDSDADGEKDGGETGLADWTIELSDGVSPTTTAVTVSDGTYSFLNLPAGTYLICEQLQTNWVQTEPLDPICYSVVITDSNVTDVDFGNVHLIPTTGKTKGFWTNKNGKAVLEDGGGVTEEITLLVNLNLVNENGTPFDLVSSYDDIKAWFNKARAVNMAYMLSAQLASTELTVEAGTLAGGTLVYAPDLVQFSDTGEPLNGLISPIGFITIANLMAAADTELEVLGHNITLQTNSWWPYQNALRAVLDAVNSQAVIAVGP